jgi:hypothetical protein
VRRQVLGNFYERVRRAPRVTPSVGRTKQVEDMVSPIADTRADLVFRFPTWSKVAAPLAVAFILAPLVVWVFAVRQAKLGALLLSLAVAFIVGSELFRRSFLVRLSGSWVEDVDLLGRRRIPIAQLRQVRVYRGRRVWLVFDPGVKPVCILRGMGRPAAVVDAVVARARQVGITPEVVNVRA